MPPVSSSRPESSNRFTQSRAANWQPSATGICRFGFERPSTGTNFIRAAHGQNFTNGRPKALSAPSPFLNPVRSKASDCSISPASWRLSNGAKQRLNPAKQHRQTPITRVKFLALGFSTGDFFNPQKLINQLIILSFMKLGAGEGNRTLISGLGSPHSTTEPHPLTLRFSAASPPPLRYRPVES